MKRKIAAIALIVSMTLFGISPAIAGKLDKSFLTCLKEQSVSVNIFLSNGTSINGKIKNFNDEVIFLDVLGSGADQLFYIHGITWIQPDSSNMSCNT